MGILSSLFGWLFGSSREQQEAPQVVPREEPEIRFTDEFERVLLALEGTQSPILVTGKAGTGKSTLLRCFRERTGRNVVVVAPTGMAALNVRGVTIHSFFKFPPTLIDKNTIRINHAKVEVFKKIHTIVIDEVSMVRADLLDAIDASLRLHRGVDRPFGNVQVVMFGDICQLPPVVKGDALKQYFSTFYKTPYFLSAHVLKETGILVFELFEIHRQSDDPDFIEILERVRHAEATVGDMIRINQQYDEAAPQNESDSRITLTTTNKLADQINQDRLNALPLPEFRSEANISGDIDVGAYPSPKMLILKKGAHIMMTKNGDLWVNGSLGVVSGWDENTVSVSLQGRTHAVPRETWEVIDYRYNKKENRVEELVAGKFEQYPLRLGWAITIHKSQGQTFEKVTINMGKGAFAHGQLYVALSRCKSLSGIRMARPIDRITDMCFDPRLTWFINRIKSNDKKAGVFVNLRPESTSGQTPIQANAKTTDQDINDIGNSDLKTMIDNAIETKTTIAISYMDYEGNKSERVVTPVEWIDSDKFRAHCHLRSDERHFLVSRITCGRVL